MALAMIPPLVSAPGRMPADTKLYLYLDPWRLLGDARWSWDSRQMAGWVPHQSISYLWPSGPWYALADLARLPDWVAHRLWIGLVLVSAGWGVRWAARQLGLAAPAAFVAAVAYQTSPYVLAYVSRTSLMLAPYAALGWLIGLTIRSAHRGGWRHPALFALVIATVGAPNATATAMIVPAPVIWLLVAAGERRISWGRAASSALRIGGLSLAVSTWWISMLAVQARHGADVLRYSETLEAVSLTASSTEVLRGLGYWLFYIRDAFEYATTAAIDYQASSLIVATSVALPALGLCGLALGSWRERRFAVLLLAVGVVAAVGAFPIYDPAPLMAPIAEAPRSTLALALRSSTRAIPLVVFALALGTGHLTTALRTRLRRSGSSIGIRLGRSPLIPAGAIALAVVNLPILWTAGFVDPALDRDAEVPDAWTSAAAHLDSLEEGRRVLRIPGAEFGAFRWGYTVDPPLPGLTDRAVVTRDLLPLGSPAAMDLLYAFDDRIQTGVLEPASIAPVARLLGADVVWLTNDAAFDRFSTARPEPLAEAVIAAPGLGEVISFGEPTANQPERSTLETIDLADDRIARPRPPVELVTVDDPVPILRTKTEVVVLAGSGDGIVDAAAAGLIDGHELLLYAASAEPADRLAWWNDADRFVVTDTDRVRAHHWRSSQDVWGFTEDIGGTLGVLRAVDGDQRLAIVDRDRSLEQTYARQSGNARARATSYGNLFSYQPEHRPYAAIDGDPSTAWLVGDRTDPTGEILQVELIEPTARLGILQPLDPTTGRWIEGVEIRTDTAEPLRVTLDERSRSITGQGVALTRPARRIELVITSTTGLGDEFQHWDPVGFAEINTGSSPSTETVVLASPVLTEASVTTPLDVVLTRWRVGDLDQDRSDPEPWMDRLVPLGASRDFEIAVSGRIAPRASDEIVSALLGLDGATASRRLTGDLASGGWSATDGDATTVWRPPLDGSRGAVLSIPLDPSALAEDAPLVVRQRLDDRTSRITRIGLGLDGVDLGVFSVSDPDSEGRSVIDIDPVVMSEGRRLDLRIVDMDAVTTLEAATAVPVELPPAVAEVTGAGIGTWPVDLDEVVDTGCREDLVLVGTTPLAIRMTTTIGDVFARRPATVTRCEDDPVTLGAGPVRILTAPGHRTGLDLDRIVMQAAASPSPAGARPATQLASTGPSTPPAQASAPLDDVSGGPSSNAVRDVERERTRITATVGPCPQGCWFVHGEGYNTGWQARVDGVALGAGRLVDGGFNGWWLDAFEDTVQMEVIWQPQRFADLGLVLSLISVGMCLLLAFGSFGRRRSIRSRRQRGVGLDFEDADPSDAPEASPEPADGSGPREPAPERSGRLVSAKPWWGAVGLGAGAAVTIGPDWGLITLVVVSGAVALRRSTWCGYLAGALAITGAGVILVRMRANRELPGPLWPEQFIDLHRPGLVVVALLVASTLPLRPRRVEGSP